MSRARLAVLTLVAASACSDDPPTAAEQEPFRDEWVTEVETDFPYLDEEGLPAITKLTIGSDGQGENFINRGDVIVKYDGPDNKIKVEMRRFTWRESADAARTDYDKTFLYAYVGQTGTSPDPPGENNATEDNNCNAEDPNTGDPLPWLDQCSIRVYYQGQIQPSRLGADIRVTMPANFRHQVDVRTSDNDAEEDYLNRGDVCLEGLNGVSDIVLESGLAMVILGSDITPGPTCAPDDVKACEELVDGDGNNAAWDPNCPCQDFGRVKVETQDSAASNITFDVPSDLWAYMTLENRGEQEKDGFHCDVKLNWDGDMDITQDDRRPWGPVVVKGNHPSPAAVEGAGFSVTGFSGQCAPVLHTGNPADYGGAGMGDQQTSKKRGDIEVCNDCLRDMTCDELLSG